MVSPRAGRAGKRPRVGDLLDPRRSPRAGAPPKEAIEAPVEKLLLALLYSGVAAVVIGGGHLGSAGVPGLLGLLGLLLSANYLFGRHFAKVEPAFARSTRSQVGFYGAVLGLLLLARALFDGASVDVPWLPYLLPLSLVTLVARIVHGQRFALEVTAYTSLLVGLLLVVEGQPHAPILQLLAVLWAGAMVAAILTGSIRKRSKLVKVGAAVGIAQAATLLCFQGLTDAWEPMGLLLVGVQGLAVGYFVTGSLPMIESLFQVLTDISLLELCNENDQPLLKKLLLTAPGTHHHSFIVGILAEAAAEAVGANPLLCRAGAYYHDIGKMAKPEYFAENQPDGGNRHENLEPAMSALIICAHTKDGLEIGRRYGLHPSILEFIPTHHGTSRIEYFYHKAVAQEGSDRVSDAPYRYAGPRPRTKETGIVNIADAVEASTRSLTNPTPASIRNKVREMILKRMMDRQLDETGLTFADLTRVEDAFVRVLVGIFHFRPQYPRISVGA